MKIEPYVLVKSQTNHLDFYHYLHIVGGSGDKGRRPRYGGEFDFILFYCLPDALDECQICQRIWCEEKGIVYGEGKSIDEAYEDWARKVLIKPITCGKQNQVKNNDSKGNI